MSGDDLPRPLILAIDPGREKCGLALVDAQGRPRFRAIVPTTLAPARIAEWRAAYSPDHILLGSGTGSRPVRDALAALSIAVELTAERDTTRRARALFFADHPPRGLRRLIPRGLLTPPVP